MAAAESLMGPAFWLITAGVASICFLSGPFGTFDALPSGFRLIYWTLIALITGGLAVWIHSLIRTQNWTSIPKISSVSVVFGLMVVGVVFIISQSLLGPIQRYPGHLEIFIYSFPSATIIFFVSVLLDRSRAKSPELTNGKRPDLIGRLTKHPNAQRILTLCAQDHYVEVTTELGSELCLIRLVDAIAEAAPEEGIQIHRSHWVAKSVIEKFVKKGSLSQVRLIDGKLLAVSQSRIAELEAYLAAGRPPNT